MKNGPLEEEEEACVVMWWWHSEDTDRRSGFRLDKSRQEENGKSAESNENHTNIIYTSVQCDGIPWPN